MTGRGRRAAAVAAWAALGLGSSAAAASDPGQVARGEYVFNAAGCLGCHTNEDGGGPPLAGGRPLETPFGTFYTPNITPDPEHGIGRWTEADFVRALSEGVAPDGSSYYPAFPYPSYTRMRPEDARALWAYLSTREPAAVPNRPHDLAWFVRLRLVNRVWKRLYFEPGPYRDDPGRSPEWNRGAYLAQALGHCGECHTPRDALGAVEGDMAYAGTREGAEGDAVPNITPDRETGIGRWSQGDLEYFLETGATPSGDYTGGAMAEVVDNTTSRLTAEDRRALATYLRSLPPVQNQVTEPRESKKSRGEFD